MEKRKLGKSGSRIAPLMFGGNVFGWTADEAMSFKLLDGFVGAGLNAIDTADVYSRWVPGHKGGESETIIGKWLKARGRARQGRHRHQGRHARWRPTARGCRKAYILRARRGLAEAAADRLHRPLPVAQRRSSDAARGDARPPTSKLIEQGKVRAIGASNYTAPRLAEALKASAAKKLPRYESLQPHYNLYERAGFEAELEPLCLKEKVGVIPYYSLASGFLTGKYRSEADFGKSPRGGGMKSYLNERGPAHPEGARRGRRAHEAKPGAGGARLADGAAQHHRADRQRHQHGAARGPRRLDAPEARRRGHRAARRRQRLSGLSVVARTGARRR